MRTGILRRSSVFVLLMGAMVVSSTMGAYECGDGLVMISGESEPVDINCAVGDVWVMDGTANLVTGGEVVNLNTLEGCTVNISGGAITENFELSQDVVATVYTASVELIEGILAEGQTQIVNNGSGVLDFDLVGTYEDGSPFSIFCKLQVNARLNLNIPQTSPEIEVLPAMLEYDFGDVAMGETVTYVAHIMNMGTDVLQVTSLALDTAGSTDFSISAAPEVPFTIAPSESIVVDIEIAYTPSAEGYASTTLLIGSDDEDEPVVEVDFGGVGIVVEVPPEEQIQAILDFIDASVADGTLVAYGPGNRPQRRLCALKHMIRAAGSLIEAGYPEWAVCVLHSVDRKTDGERRPPDFVVGEATAALNQMVNDLIEDLSV